MKTPNRSLLFFISLVVTAAPLITGPVVIANYVGGISLASVVPMLGALYAVIAALVGMVLQRRPATREVGMGILWGACAGVILGISTCVASTDFINVFGLN